MTKKQAQKAARAIAVELIQDWLNQNRTSRFGEAFGVTYEDCLKINSALCGIREELENGN